MKVTNKSYSFKDYDRRVNQNVNPICEAVDCYEAATETIVVPAGKFGTITLNLCYGCSVSKFDVRTSKI